MAKKDIGSLVGSFISKDPKPTSTPRQTTTTNNQEGGNKKSAETRATFVVDPEQIRKIKYIALAEEKLHKVVISEALGAYIAQWEATNGTINLPSR